MCDCQHLKSVYCILLTSNVNCGLFCIWNDFGNLALVLQDHLNAPGEGKRVIQMWKRADDRWQNLKYRQACYPYTVFSKFSKSVSIFLFAVVLHFYSYHFCFRLEFRIRYINQWISSKPPALSNISREPRYCLSRSGRQLGVDRLNLTLQPCLYPV